MAPPDARPRFVSNVGPIVHVRSNGTGTCPHCGAITPEPQLTNLSPNQRKVYLYVGRHPGCVWQDIADHIYANDSNGGPLSARTCIATFIYYANRRLKGQRIACTGGAGATYYLVKDQPDVSPELTPRLP